MGDRYDDERSRRGPQREADRDRREGAEAGAYREPHDDDRTGERPQPRDPNDDRWQGQPRERSRYGASPYDQGRYESSRFHESARPWNRPWEGGRPYYEPGRVYDDPRDPRSADAQRRWAQGPGQGWGQGRRDWRGEGRGGADWQSRREWPRRDERAWQDAWQEENVWRREMRPGPMTEDSWRQEFGSDRPVEFDIARVEVYDAYGPPSRYAEPHEHREHHGMFGGDHEHHRVGAAIEHLKEGVRRAFRGLKGYKRTDERVREDVCDRINHLSQRAGIDVSDVEVNVKDGDVTLSGTMTNRRHKHLIENEADTVSGVRDVHNQVRVRSEREREEAFTAASQSLTSGASVPVGTENGNRSGRSPTTGGMSTK